MQTGKHATTIGGRSDREPLCQTESASLHNPSSLIRSRYAGRQHVRLDRRNLGSQGQITRIAMFRAVGTKYGPSTVQCIHQLIRPEIFSRCRPTISMRSISANKTVSYRDGDNVLRQGRQGEFCDAM